MTPTATSTWLASGWVVAIAIAVVLAVLVVGIVLGVRAWRRRSSTARLREGASLGARLRAASNRFHDGLSLQARHFPTFVVMGEAGAGKTHLLSARVDWRGQANQFQPSSPEHALVQFYLGADVIVHELSAVLLHDVTPAARRALTRLWRNVGPSVTVVVVIDARTLATAPPGDLRALAQLVRGKIGLLPPRVLETVEVRVCLTHLDRVEGFREFAAVLGTHEHGLELERMGPEFTDAGRLLAAFDGHLTHGLTTLGADAFAQLVRFYDAFAALLRTLPPLLSALRGQAWYGRMFPPRALYLGSILPHSYVGDPFEASAGAVVTSILGHNRRTIVRAAALAIASLAFVGIMTGVHVRSIARAEDAVVALCQGQDAHPEATPAEVAVVDEAAAAIERMSASEVLWLHWMQYGRKQQIDRKFEVELRDHYLLPRIDHDWNGVHEHTPASSAPQAVRRAPSTKRNDEEKGADRIDLMYVVSLLRATRDNALGHYVRVHASWWAKALGLNERIIEYYIVTSERPFEQFALPEVDVVTGREWSQHYERLCGPLKRRGEPLSRDEVKALRRLPTFRSKAEYEALEGARQHLLADPSTPGSVEMLVNVEQFDAQWVAVDHEDVSALADALTVLGQAIDAWPALEPGWGLTSLVLELQRVKAWQMSVQATDSSSELKDTVRRIDDYCELAPGTTIRAVSRMRTHEAIRRVLSTVQDRMHHEQIRAALVFFDEGERLREAVPIRGYGGGAAVPILREYTRAAFERRVVPTLRYAAETQPCGEEADDAKCSEIVDADLVSLRAAVGDAIEDYAKAYGAALMNYYDGFELEPGSNAAVSFALKALTQPSSWFTEFLRTIAIQTSVPLDDDAYHEPMRRVLEGFGPLVALLNEDKGMMPGLEPYFAILRSLPLGGGVVAMPRAADDGLEARLSPLGQLALASLRGQQPDLRVQVQEWLDGAQIDEIWWRPFEVPLELVYRAGVENIDDVVSKAWMSEVRPVLRPLLTTYPFDPAAREDARIAEIEAYLRRQGAEPGEFWSRFDRFVAPATRATERGHAMLDGLRAPRGMLETVGDVQALSAALWDASGQRTPLALVLAPMALPSDPHDGRTPSMAYVQAGGAVVYAFNQRPQRQTFALRWWEQGNALVSLTLLASDGQDRREHTVEAGDSPFSFYRLLDLAHGCPSRPCPRESTPTRIAIDHATRCGGVKSTGTKDQVMRWDVPVDDEGKVYRDVRVVLVDDPWALFAVRDCP